MPVCLLWWGDPLPQIPHPVSVLQCFSLLLVCQLCDGTGPGHTVWRLCFVLLGLQKARRYPCLPHLRLLGTGPSVSGRTCICVLSLSAVFVHFLCEFEWDKHWSVSRLTYLCDNGQTFEFVLPAVVQIPHRLPGFWLSNPIYGPDDQGHSGVPGSQAERSAALKTRRLSC